MNILSSTISWLLQSRLPSTSPSPNISCVLLTSNSNRPSSLVRLSLTCVRKLSSAHFRSLKGLLNVQNYSILLYFYSILFCSIHRFSPFQQIWELLCTISNRGQLLWGFLQLSEESFICFLCSARWPVAEAYHGVSCVPPSSDPYLEALNWLITSPRAFSALLCTELTSPPRFPSWSSLNSLCPPIAAPTHGCKLPCCMSSPHVASFQWEFQ